MHPIHFATSTHLPVVKSRPKASSKQPLSQTTFGMSNKKDTLEKESKNTVPNIVNKIKNKIDDLRCEDPSKEAAKKDSDSLLRGLAEFFRGERPGQRNFPLSTSK